MTIRILTAAFVITAALAIAPRGAAAQTPGGVIYACVKSDGDGAIRMVPASEACKKNETRIQWSAAVPWTYADVERTPRFDGDLRANAGLEFSTFEMECPAGELRGFEGFLRGIFSFGYGISLAPACASGWLPSFGSSTIRKKAVNARLDWIGSNPFFQSTPTQNVTCPAGYSLVGVSGSFAPDESRVGWRPYLVSLKTHCRSQANPGQTIMGPILEPPFFEYLPLFAIATPFSLQCTGDRMVTGVFGTVQTVSAFPQRETRVTGLGLTCQ